LEINVRGGKIRDFLISSGLAVYSVF